ncbi:DUF262 domain-containing protein [Cyclobacterium sp. SYSU L10401]|uniref:DUF262 domain-containing protein n=1 Tax=Cyclobacterium sp. SYSU L10401 TaxID=2678657 RepID=UPI0013D3D9C9|nr:DUF262 domain-containing protein [Cyclobacterium sp. SYSU L10401]
MRELSQKNKIDSSELTLKKVAEKGMFFNVPIYQRLYVWGEDQVKTLLEDIRSACEQNDARFYLGGIMTIKNKEYYDLIDGQQRFTTLWLIAKELGGRLNQFANDSQEKELKPRLHFAVRDFANHYLQEGQREKINKEDREQLGNIIDASGTIKAFVNTELGNVERDTLIDFIYEKVLIINTELYPEIDETKVFEQMNNRGAQLEPHEILKARMLEQLPSQEERYLYSVLWDSCAVMHNYIERNLKELGGFEWKELIARSSDNDLPSLVEVKKLLIQKAIYQGSNATSLSEILKQKDEEIQEIKETEIWTEVRSIIDFPMLLLHTLRIFQYEVIALQYAGESVEVKGKMLIKLFEEKFGDYFKHRPDRVKDFIELLWEVRYNFDKHIIKWVHDEEQVEVHLIKPLYKSETSFQRNTPEKNEGFALLQSMLYHSQQITTHYWLTPLLHRLIKRKSSHNHYLEALDNAMFCNPKQDLRINSYDLIGKGVEELRSDIHFVIDFLKSGKGTSYPSYWFYKLEYLLWKERSLFNADKWEGYRMTAKNSVEHISAQKPKLEELNRLTEDGLSNEENKRRTDDFGNLVLLTSSMNSEYSHKIFNVKRQEFLSKRRLDSLKSDLIFRNENWNWEKCKKHRDEMVDLFKKHLSKEE